MKFGNYFFLSYYIWRRRGHDMELGILFFFRIAFGGVPNMRMTWSLDLSFLSYYIWRSLGHDMELGIFLLSYSDRHIHVLNYVPLIVLLQGISLSGSEALVMELSPSSFWEIRSTSSYQ